MKIINFFQLKIQNKPSVKVVEWNEVNKSLDSYSSSPLCTQGYNILHLEKPLISSQR